MFVVGYAWALVHSDYVCGNHTHGTGLVEYGCTNDFASFAFIYFSATFAESEGLAERVRRLAKEREHARVTARLQGIEVFMGSPRFHRFHGLCLAKNLAYVLPLSLAYVLPLPFGHICRCI